MAESLREAVAMNPDRAAGRRPRWTTVATRITQLKSLWKDRAGSVTVYAAVFSVVAIGAGALVIDYGRAALLNTEMQSAADAAAMSGAFHLDGKDGARARATSVAVSALNNTSGIPDGGGATQLTVNPAQIFFYSQITPDKVAATSDLDAKIIEVGLTG